MTLNIYKILVLGASGVGKTKILSHFADYLYKGNTRNDIPFQKISYVLRDNDKIGILGLDFILKGSFLEDRNFRFHFWDFKGNDDKLSAQYFKGAAGALILFDHSKPETFERAIKYIEIIQKLNCPYGIIGTKADENNGEDIRYTDMDKATFCIDVAFNSLESSNTGLEDLKNKIEEFLLKILNEKYVKAFQKNLNQQILITLHSHDMLSLTELAKILDKSKSTISRKTRILITLGLIKAKESESEKTRGSIKKKYYSIRNDFQNLIERENIEFPEKSDDNDIIKIREENWKKIYLTSIVHHQSGLILDILKDNLLTESSFRENKSENFRKLISNISLRLDFLNRDLDETWKEKLHFELAFPLLRIK